MTVTNDNIAPWLLLVFSLPSSRASQRVEVWRKLRRYGTLALKSAGYVLPNSATNQERLEWLAAAIRAYKGQASVALVQGFDDMPNESLKKQFLDARSQDYETVLRDLKKMLAVAPARRSKTAVTRLRRRFQEIEDVDFFSSPLRSRVETLFTRLDEPSAPKTAPGKKSGGDYQNRV